MSRAIEATQQVCLADAAEGESRVMEIAQFTLAHHNCHVLCVDDVVPRHTVTPQGVRPRLLYADGELAHFELAGHIYAVVSDVVLPPVDARAAREAAVARSDVRELLTNRELQIVQLICMGCITKQVADRLRLSEFTVRSYLKTIYCKLGVRSRGAMVYRYAQAFQRAVAPVA